MPDGPLAKFRKMSERASVETPAGAPEQYAAFGKAEGRAQERLIINRLTGDTHAPSLLLLPDGCGL